LSVNALDVVNEILTQAGYSVTSNALVGTDDTHGNKVYRSLQRGVEAITIASRNYGFNEPLVTLGIVLNDEVLTLPTSINPHYIQMVMLTKGTTIIRKVLARTTFEKFTRDILPNVNPTSTGEPARWYILDNGLRIHPISDGTYTLTFYAQGMPQRWNAIDSTSTTLNIDDTMRELLIMCGLWRFLKMINDPDWKEFYFMAEDPRNKQSMLRQVMISNKLSENQALRRIKISGQSHLDFHL